MAQTFDFHAVGRLPQPGDNVGIATQNLDADTRITYQERTFTLDHSILEGHRFAVRPIAPGTPLLSWGLPFGAATRTIDPGAYVCNPQILEALSLRNLDFALPSEANFEDRIEPYLLDETTFCPGATLPLHSEGRTFLGYPRPGKRGVGTRNCIVILGTSSQTGSYARKLATRLKHAADACPNIDGIVAVSHTEGGNRSRPNNLNLLIRTLAGFCVHPNVGAVLVVDYGTEALTNSMLRSDLESHGYPLHDVPHRFLTLSDGFEANLQQGETIVRGWLERVNRTHRAEAPVSHLKIALQCGGSDAFSGISGNPLVAWVARETIRYGGTANLAETDELIGAEPYVLQNVKDLDVAHRFLQKIEAFKELAAWHGTTAEGNPSGGNKFRGLYNIVLKSIGAAQKRHPEVRLDDVIDYGAPMREPGYYFMDSPGNDLESIAGQVASGCNMIFFVTGNGSITNFPFVPTLKVITTTQRYELLSREMDVNAGAYLDGTPMDELGRKMLDLTLDVASGQLSKGELAGHAQVSIWRNWQQTNAENVAAILARPDPDGTPMSIPPAAAQMPLIFEGIRTPAGPAADQIGLILPTSLCSAEVARMTADWLTRKKLGRDRGLSRFVALPHTEGCGHAGDTTERLLGRTMLGHLTHPLVQYALLMEHGCEKIHNDYIRHQLQAAGIAPERFGWTSIQMDGGIENTMVKAEAWFSDRLAGCAPPTYEPVSPAGVSIGLMSTGAVSGDAARVLAQFTRVWVAAGGTVVVPETAGLLRTADYLSDVLNAEAITPTLPHGQPIRMHGFHIMENPTEHWVETLAGIGGTGAQIILAYTGEHPMQGHPLLPLLQISATPATLSAYRADLDLCLDAPDAGVAEILTLVLNTASRQYIPSVFQQGNIDFQLTRGLLGVSM